jgi:hypothetical protein
MIRRSGASQSDEPGTSRRYFEIPGSMLRIAPE